MTPCHFHYPNFALALPSPALPPPPPSSVQSSFMSTSIYLLILPPLTNNPPHYQILGLQKRMEHGRPPRHETRRRDGQDRRRQAHQENGRPAGAPGPWETPARETGVYCRPSASRRAAELALDGGGVASFGARLWAWLLLVFGLGVGIAADMVEELMGGFW